MKSTKQYQYLQRARTAYSVTLQLRIYSKTRFEFSFIKKASPLDQWKRYALSPFATQPNHIVWLLTLLNFKFIFSSIIFNHFSICLKYNTESNMYDVFQVTQIFFYHFGKDGNWKVEIDKRGLRWLDNFIVVISYLVMHGLLFINIWKMRKFTFLTLRASNKEK
jgi:hypothetical protein